jgi:hypothetical protein
MSFAHLSGQKTERRRILSIAYNIKRGGVRYGRFHHMSVV